MTVRIGRSVPRLEGRAKVTGRVEYIHNLRLPGMLFGKVFRSTVAHGRIRAIDTAAASALPGVVRVVTGEDVRRLIPSPYYGPAFHDQPILALDKVRFVGEPVAVVLAADPHVAEAAVQLILADYEELPAVYDEIEALGPDVIVHDELKPAGTFADLKHLAGRRNTNVALDFHLRRGNAEEAFRNADHVFEHIFRTQPCLHLPFEPLVAVSDPVAPGLVIHSATQTPSFVRTEIARLLGWPESRVRVKVGFLGGGFGAKVYIKLEAMVAALALLARRPVKVSLTMEEQFYHITKHPTTFRIRSAVDNRGRVIGRRCDVWWNGGAYADIGPRVTQKSGFTAAGPYDIENVWIDSYELYTNRPPAGALRGFGIPQLVWAYESHTDLVARGLGIDPIEFRRRNILRDGRPQATGTTMQDAGIADVLDALAYHMNWNAPFGRGSGVLRRGRGIAIGFKASISPTTSVAIVSISADGSTALFMNTVDMGQGAHTTMALIVAEVLDIAAETVRVVLPDTDVTPYDMGTLGSRSTFHMGNAVQRAAQDARARLEALAAEAGLPPGTNLPVSEIFRKRYGMQAGNVIGTGTYIPDYAPPDPATGQSPNVTPFWMVGGTGAEVEVDTETGHVRVTRLVNVADAGTPLNPKVAVTQLTGAAIMQLGFTMFEEMMFDAGQVTNASLADYKIPGIHDVPALKSELVAAAQHNGPFGAKGLGESGTFGVSPAIANAIHDAIGVRLTELPLKPEAVLRAIHAAQGRPIPEDGAADEAIEDASPVITPEIESEKTAPPVVVPEVEPDNTAPPEAVAEARSDPVVALADMPGEQISSFGAAAEDEPRQHHASASGAAEGLDGDQADPAVAAAEGESDHGDPPAVAADAESREASSAGVADAARDHVDAAAASADAESDPAESASPVAHNEGGHSGPEDAAPDDHDAKHLDAP